MAGLWGAPKQLAASVQNALEGRLWFFVDIVTSRLAQKDETGAVLTYLAAGDAQPFINFAANQFGARSSAGAYAAKPITDPALVLLSQTTLPLMKTAGLGFGLVGVNLSVLSAPAAVSFPQVNVDGSITMSTAAQARTALSVNNVDDTSDANKPISTAQATEFARLQSVMLLTRRR